MRQCPLCQSLFPNDVEFCSKDGRILLDPDPLLGQVIDGKYRIESLLGTGGQGAVYRATHLHLQRIAAFKVVRSDFLTTEGAIERFRSEAATIAQLSNPHIIMVHDFGLASGVGAYLVMEYLEGRSLRAAIRERRRIGPSEAIAMMLQTCAAVGAAHDAGVIHRDLKPDNVFLEREPDGGWAVKILDFGIAEMVGTEGLVRALEAEAEQTTTGKIYGTPIYMSPEQCQGGPLDRRTDIYSLGCVLYEMLAGKPPFVGARISEVFRKHQSELPVPPSKHAPGISPELDAVVLRMLEKSPEKRFASIAEVVEAIEDAHVTATGAVARRAEPETHEPETDSEPTFVDMDLPATNLPRQMTTFIGREEQMATVEQALGSNRLVTLTGPSGAGKTRLSIQVGLGLLTDFPDGVWLVELATLKDPALVPQAIASTLGVADNRADTIVGVLLDYLRDKRLLLVLDNCEHLIPACSEFVSLVLRSAPSLRLLCTSQEALGIAGEIRIAVPALLLPETTTAPTRAEIIHAEAVRLFVDRARLASPGFELTDENAAAVARVCRRLDGLPLALELAAARVKLLSVEQIDARLDDRFRLLTSGSRTAGPRQRTLHAAIDWSYELLDEQERMLFERLSVFAGGFTLDAVEAVCSGDGLSSHNSIELISRLVDRSLVTVASGGAGARYRMLETLRQYGAERLVNRGEAAIVRRRHRDYYLRLAEEGQAELKGPDAREWLERLETEHDNLRAALEWSKTDATDSDALLRLAGALARFWLIRGYSREGRVWIAEALSMSRDSTKLVRARALFGAGMLAWVLGDYASAQELHDEALEIRRDIGDGAGIAGSLNAIGFVLQGRGEYESAAALHGESLSIARELGERWEEASALNNLGIVARHSGDGLRAIELLEAGLEIFRDLGDAREISNTLNNLSVVFAVRGDFWNALELIEENLALRRSIGDKRGVATSLLNMGEVKRLMGDYVGAVDLLRRSLLLYDEAGDTRNLAYAIEGLMMVAVAEKRPDRALRLVGATAALRQSIGSPLSPAEAEETNKQLEEAREAIGEGRAKQLVDAGRAMTREQAIAYALEGARRR